MKPLILSLFIIVAIIAILMPDESSGAAAKFRGRSLRFNRRGRAKPPFRRIGAVSRGNNRRKSFAFRPRQGRTFFRSRRGRTSPVQEDLLPPANELNDLESEPIDPATQEEEIVEELEVPHWCNPKHNMGPWMNFSKMRVWCRDNGFTKLSPYGGVPAEEEEEEEEEGRGGDVEETAIDADSDY